MPRHTFCQRCLKSTVRDYNQNGTGRNFFHWLSFRSSILKSSSQLSFPKLPLESDNIPSCDFSIGTTAAVTFSRMHDRICSQYGQYWINLSCHHFGRNRGQRCSKKFGKNSYLSATRICVVGQFHSELAFVIFPLQRKVPIINLLKALVEVWWKNWEESLSRQVSRCKI